MAAKNGKGNGAARHEAEAPEPRTALVTGGNRGIGLEVCRQLARRGLRVILTARDQRLGRGAAASLHREGLEVEFRRLDVTEAGAPEALADTLRRAERHLDVLVNNAAVYPQGGALEVGEDTAREAFETNLFGPLRLCRAFLPGMLERGYGRIVNVSSGDASFGEKLAGPAAYCISKTALNALTVKLAQLARGDVKVNCVCPGWVRTRMGGPNATRGVRKGAETIVWLATLPPDGPNGGFFRDRKAIPW
ncbi:MAG TPA: SDR family oxidoreductase [Candidatus Saccharimonadales bacterium]|nr:SDR family oxidoreductase [Candidatus Saccharimonadales bacterium]